MSQSAAVDGAPGTADRNNTSTTGVRTGEDTADNIVVPGSAEPELTDADWGKTWRLLPLPAASSYGASVVATPAGWFEVSSRVLGSKATPPPYDSFVYRSLDGTHWRALALGADLKGASLAYGNGHYVITGSRHQKNVVLDSLDGETWREQVLDDPNPWSQGPVQYVHDRFFFMTASLWGSVDGEQWSLLDHPYSYSQLDHIAYGNGRYLGVGTETELSLDGAEWRSAPVDCALPEVCITDPAGSPVENGYSALFFAEDQFHLLPFPPLGSPEGGLSSPDGESWQFTPGFLPDAYVGGHFVRLFDAQPRVWLANGMTPRSLDVIHRSSMLPPGLTPAQAERWSAPTDAENIDNAFPTNEAMAAEIDLSWSDGLDCTSARCLVVTSGSGSQLLLVP